MSLKLEDDRHVSLKLEVRHVSLKLEDVKHVFLKLDAHFE